MSFRSMRATLVVCSALVAMSLAPPLMGTSSLSATATARGLDSPTCFGREATIVGTTGDDVVSGTKANDVIHALAGHDSIYALGLGTSPDLELGNDYICAGPGDDDPVDGGGGNDHIAGGRGSDGLFGHEGNDTILGGGGTDEIEPHAGGDVISGGAKPDELCASAGRDEIRGGQGPDLIGWCGSIRTGTDLYLGGPGDDRISSVDVPQQTSADVVKGGPGTDTCTIDPEDTATNCETVEIG
jgi:Ca2+-binding RTX toxin-like protein